MPRTAVKLCKENTCKNTATTHGYCRLCYLKNWRLIQVKQKKKAADNLNKYVDHIMKKHPDNYVDAIKHDLRNADRFQSKANQYFEDGDYRDVMEDMDFADVSEKIANNLKVDDNV